MQKEIWKDVFEYEGLYQVSNLGNVNSLDRVITRLDGTKYFKYGQIIKTRQGKDGNVRVNLCKDGVKRVHSLARIVYKAFNPDFDYYDSNLMIIYKNNKGEDNELANLYIKSRNEVMILNGDEIIIKKRKVKCITTGEIFESVSDAERYYNIKSGSGSISKCCSGKQKHAIILEEGTKLQWEYVE
jgi:hypothetical protein